MTTAGTVSEGGKQQWFRNFGFLGHQGGGAAGGESTLIRRGSRRHPEIRAGRGPENTQQQNFNFWRPKDGR